MPLLPPSLRMYLPDVPAAQSLIPVPDATAGLGYDSATRAYVDRMGRMMSASQAPRGLYDSVQSSGRVLERLVNGPGDNLTAQSQAARAAKAQSFGKNLRGAIARGVGRAGMLGLGAAGIYGLGVGANGLGSNLADYMFDSDGPTVGVRKNYLDATPESGPAAMPNIRTKALITGIEKSYLDPRPESGMLQESRQAPTFQNENQLMQRFIPSMFRDDPADGAVTARLTESPRTRALQTGTVDMGGGWLGNLAI